MAASLSVIATILAFGGECEGQGQKERVQLVLSHIKRRLLRAASAAENDSETGIMFNPVPCEDSRVNDMFWMGITAMMFVGYLQEEH